MNTNQTDTNQMQEQEIDLIELFYKLLAHWRWFLLAAVVALAGAYICTCNYSHLSGDGFCCHQGFGRKQ